MIILRPAILALAVTLGMAVVELVPLAKTTDTLVVKRYDVLEETLAVGNSYPNPWEDVNLTVTVRPPAGPPFRIGGFYYAGDAWKIRIAPWMVGRWSWTAEARDRSGKLFERVGAFQVVASVHRGFVRRDPANPFRLVFDDGTLYPAIGIGDCIAKGDSTGGPPQEWGLDGDFRSPRGPHQRSVDIDTYLAAYAQAGFNLFRWSVDNCAFRLWDRITPAGNRYLALEGQWGDGLVQKLRQYGFRIYMVLFDSPPFPHRAKDPAAMAAVRKYVQYVVDRYGAYVDLWELMNESDAENAWYTTVAGMLRKADPYHHLISTSWERPRDPAIDITSPHWYGNESEFQSDEVTQNQVDMWKGFKKPIIFGEQGNSKGNWDEHSALRMRLRSWSAFFNEAVLVFWNTSGFKGYKGNLYLGPEERSYLRALQAFVGNAPPDLQKTAVRVSDPLRVRAYGLRSSTFFAAYLHNFADHARPTTDLWVTLNSPIDGKAVWYNPATGATIQIAPVVRGPLRVPPFVVDIALKIQRLGP